MRLTYKIVNGWEHLRQDTISAVVHCPPSAFVDAHETIKERHSDLDFNFNDAGMTVSVS